MPRALVVGSPIDHSLSPTLHEAGYRAAGLDDWSYARAEVVADEVRAFVARLDHDVVGLSVTMPCKEAALAVADEASALAGDVGAANTLVRRDGGWFADNTDVHGVVEALRAAGCAGGRGAVVIGSGATARSVVAALSRLGVREVMFVVRAQARPETLALARSLGMSTRVVREDDEDAAWAVGMALLVVQTSPAGGADALAARVVDAPSLRIGAAGGPFVLDVVYADWPTAFARTMSARGATVVSGLDMLVHQAAAQFELFTGHAAPIADMMEAGRAAVK
ncbi:shikimate dehydrogenase [Dermacoccus nishinomiyaensis]|uniref:shikimate dehydrogenase n=1 Tax=Dermacoccus TaxID=57495 RepID=UPI00093BCE82|nr:MULTISPECIES: shikimate dehydrogenase [Dermacoccus]NHC30445.1 shikimate dehydrogenase [Dermacoccus nishinomiyaensis]TJZ97349.1 shikimate dehydrogenase [Dermacoccus nishinomiyaensis]